MASTNICSVIVSKLHHNKKPYLIILLKIDKNLEINFYYIILPLNLAVYLQIESDKEFLFDIKEII